MKKTVSVLLSVLIITCIFSVLPCSAEAESSYIIDFEAEQASFYSNGNVNRIGLSDTVDIVATADRGNVMGFKKLMVYRDDDYVKNTSDNAVVWNTIYYPTAFRLPTNDGTDTVYFEKGQKLRVSFDMKKNDTVSNAYFSKITAALVFSEAYGVGIDKGNIRDWVNNGQTAVLTTVNLNSDTDWVRYSAYITVPASGYAAFMLYGTNFATVCDIYVDNILLEDCTSLVSCTDFEADQMDFYADDANRICYADAVDLKSVEKRGNVMHFSNLKVYRTDGFENNTESGQVKWNTIYYPTAFRLQDMSGNTLYLEAGNRFSVSFQMKKNADVSLEYFKYIKAALVFADSYAIGVDTGNIRDWIENNQTTVIATVKNSADTDWVTYSTLISVPKSGYVAFMLYGENIATNCDIDVDNIVIEEFDPTSFNRNGDINRDGKIDIIDLIRLKKMSSGVLREKAYADIDFDSTVAAGDIVKLKEILFGNDSTVPYKKGNRSLVWNEEFGHNSSFSNNFVFANNMNHTDIEGYTVEYNNAERMTVKDGNLELSIGKTDTGYSVCETVSTSGTMYYKHGYLEMCAKVPFSNGAWPGFWLLGNTPYHDKTAEWFAEVDVFEVFSNEKTLYANLHKHGGQNQGYSEQFGVFSEHYPRSYTFKNYENLSSEYHIYGFEWDSTKMKFYVDGIEFFTFYYSLFNYSKYNGTEYFNDFMYVLITNEILPSVLTGTEKVTAEYSVDWIRLYQNQNNGEEIIY